MTAPQLFQKFSLLAVLCWHWPAFKILALPPPLNALSHRGTLADNATPYMEKGGHCTTGNGIEQKEQSNLISLSSFGLATYRVRGSIWTNPECSDHEKISSLHVAAASWLRQLGVDHHDFDYFVTH